MTDDGDLCRMTSEERAEIEMSFADAPHGEPKAFVNLALLLAMACGYEGF